MSGAQDSPEDIFTIGNKGAYRSIPPQAQLTTAARIMHQNLYFYSSIGQAFTLSSRRTFSILSKIRRNTSMYRQYARTIIASALLACALLFTAVTAPQVTAASRNMVVAHPATTSRECPQTVQEGSRGAAVTTLQLELNWIFGYKDVPIDSVFGPETDTAVRDFQSKAGLPANGVVDPATWHALGEC
jgi:Putative peptidoglycan binding domain